MRAADLKRYEAQMRRASKTLESTGLTDFLIVLIRDGKVMISGAVNDPAEVLQTLDRMADEIRKANALPSS